VSQAVIDYFPLGIVNSHFSLLPKWRGADPITFSILSGDRETGVSLNVLTAGMDEGPVLNQSKMELTESVDARALTEQLIIISDDLLSETIPKYLKKEIAPKPQSEDITPTYSRKLTKQDGLIDWQNKSADQILREVRAYIEWPKSYTKIEDRDIIIQSPQD